MLFKPHDKQQAMSLMQMVAQHTNPGCLSVAPTHLPHEWHTSVGDNEVEERRWRCESKHLESHKVLRIELDIAQIRVAEG